MWEFEQLVEDGIRFVDLMKVSDDEKRNLIWNLYEVQSEWDCSFTNFRVMEILEKVGYTKTTTLEEYPDYEKYAPFFKGLKEENEFAFIHRDPTKKSGKKNPTVAYWEPDDGKMYYDFGSSLWDTNKTKPKKMDAISVAEVITEFADTLQRKDIIYNWSAYLINSIFEDDDKTKSRLENIRTRFKKYDFSEHKAMHESLDLKVQDWSGDLIFWFLEIDR